MNSLSVRRLYTCTTTDLIKRQFCETNAFFIKRKRKNIVYRKREEKKNTFREMGFSYYLTKIPDGQCNKFLTTLIPFYNVGKKFIAGVRSAEYFNSRNLLSPLHKKCLFLFSSFRLSRCWYAVDWSFAVFSATRFPSNSRNSTVLT